MTSSKHWWGWAASTALCAAVALPGVGDEVMPPEAYLDQIEASHQGELYSAVSAVQADFHLDFGQFQLAGTMTFTPSLSRVRMELGGGQTLFWDGQAAWVTPADAAVPGPPGRFHVLTWPYFMAAAYKLDDPGTRVEPVGMFALQAGEDRSAVRITFADGVGDAPDDWYLAFAQPQSERLEALAYIVTYGKTKEEAEQDPGIVLYRNFVEVEGIPFATRWEFHHWNAETGVGEQKGAAELANIKLLSDVAGLFEVPEAAQELASPND